MNKRVLVLFVATYIAVLTLPLFAGVWLLVHVQKELTQQAIETSYVSLKKATAGLEEDMMELVRIGEALSDDQSVLDYLRHTSYGSIEHRMAAVDVVDTINTLCGHSNIGRDSYLFTANTNRIFSTTSQHEPEMYYRYVHRRADMSIEEWKAWLVQDNYQYFSVSKGKASAYNAYNANNEEKNVLNVVQSIPKDKLGGSEALLVSVVQIEELLYPFMGVYENGQYCIIDAIGNVLASTQGMPEIPETMAFGETWRDKNEDVYISIYTTSERLGWKVVAMLPQEAVLGGITRIKRTVMFVYVLCLVLGVGMSLFFTRMQYSPIKRILSRLENSDAPGKKMGEYEYIDLMLRRMMLRNADLENEIKATADRNSRVNQLISQSQSQIQESLLLSLLSGRMVDLVEVIDLLDLYGLRFSNRRTLVLLFMCQSDTKQLTTGIEERVRYLLKTICEQALPEGSYAYTTKLENGLFAVALNPSDWMDDEQIVQMSEELIERVEQLVEKELYLYLCCAAGSIQQSVSGLSSSFMNAVKILECKQSMRSAMRKWNHAKQDKDNLLGNLQTQIEEYLRKGNVLECCQLVFQAGDCKSNAVLAMVQAMNAVLGYMDEHEITTERLEQSGISLSSLTALEENWHHELAVLFEWLVCETADKPKQNSKFNGEAVREFIEERLGDAELNQSMIAEHFHISTSNLSKMFKREWGMNMVDYINQARVVRSQRLLKETDMSIAEIAAKVGFSSSNALHRVFKKYESISPGQYRAAERAVQEQIFESYSSKE